jgi:membrane fusion protein (multidrug efflux system)
MMEGEKSYIYTVSDENIANKTEVEIGLRGDSKVEILSGVNEG